MDNLEIFLNVPYTNHSLNNPLLQFDLYVPRAPSVALKPLICFIHGGAWRSEDKSDHTVLARKLATATGFSVIVANYRLTPQSPTPETQFQHPNHAEDVVEFLNFVIAWPGPPNHPRQYDAGRIYLMGHSCGAHMLGSIFLDSSKVTPSLTPSARVQLAVRGLILSEGIYDIDALLDRFPSYRLWFIEHAFGGKESYAHVNIASLPARSTSMQWLIIHSSDDELVDVTQSETMFRHLRQLYDAVPRADELIYKVVGSYGQHNKTLESDDFIEEVAAFIRDGIRSVTM